MSGHSKWATTKRHKAAVDAKRGKIFSVISKELTVAAAQGGGDPEANARLRTLLLKAKAANMPGDNVERAIKKGTGEIEGVTIEEMTYEAYGPGGVALIVEVSTDNKNRSASEVRSALNKHGGNMASPGALAHQFRRCGQFFIDKDAITEDALMELVMEADAEDVITEEEHYEVRCPLAAFDTLSHTLNQAKLTPSSAELVYLPTVPLEVTDPDLEKKILKLIDALDDVDDVQAVHHNLAG